MFVFWLFIALVTSFGSLADAPSRPDRGTRPPTNVVTVPSRPDRGTRQPTNVVTTPSRPSRGGRW